MKFKKTISFCFYMLFAVSLFSQEKPTMENGIETNTSNLNILDFDCTAKINFMNSSGKKIKYNNSSGLEFANWQFILDSGSTGQPNANRWNTNFNRFDEDLFYIELKSPGGNAGNTILVDLKSIGADGTTIVDQISGVLLYADGNTYRSEPMFLVSEQNIIDDNFNTDLNLSATEMGWDDVDGQGGDPNPDSYVQGDPTIYGELGGEMVVEYTSAITNTVHIGVPDNIRTVEVIVNSYASGVTDMPYVAPNIIVDQLEVVKKVFQPANIKFNITINAPWYPANTSGYLEDGVDWNDAFATSEVGEAISDLKVLGPDPPYQRIDLIYLSYINFQVGGSSTSSDWGTSVQDFRHSQNNPNFWPLSLLRTCLIGAQKSATNSSSLITRPFMTARLIAQILTNDEQDHGPFNLLKNELGPNPGSSSNFIFANKRLWDFQFELIESQTNIPQ